MKVTEFYKGKHLLLTGCTGFVGKVMLEKVLRSLPDVSTIYILIRPKAGSSLTERFKREIIGSQCFDRLKVQLGATQFMNTIAQKVRPIEGDTQKENLGLSAEIMNELIENVQVVINCAASVDFGERLDRSLIANVKGTQNIFLLSSRMKKLLNFVHVSTSYVNSDKQGYNSIFYHYFYLKLKSWIEEKIYDRDLPSAIDEADRILKLPISEIEAMTPELLGTFPNTYTYTKNIAENMLKQLRPSGFPLTIVRPSIVGSSIRDPVPGWIDSVVAAAAIYFFTGIGLIPLLYGDEELIGDQIPVDMVVDYILVAAAYNAGKDSVEVHQVGSSARNPVSWRLAKDCVREYWNKNPSSRKISKCNLQFQKNKRLYQLANQVRLVPAKAFDKFARTLGNKDMKMKASRMMKMIARAEDINDTFSHFINNEWIFDSGKVSNLINYLEGTERDTFMLDVTQIKWREYLLTFNNGIHRFVLKENVQPFTLDQNDILSNMNKSYFSDIEWAMSAGKPFKTKSNHEHISLVMNSQKVQSVIKSLVEERARKQEGHGPTNIIKIQKEIELEAVDMCKVMFADYSMPMIRAFGWFLTKVFRRIYDKVVIDDLTIKALQEYDSTKNGPLILIPTHRSYIDFLMCSYVFFAYKIRTPHIATAEDFLSMAVVPMILRSSGAFFLKRKQLEDNILYKTVFYEYVKRLLMDECFLEFFIEGTRSRSGKTLTPKFGLLSIVGDAVLDGSLKDAKILPIAITYEKVLEAETYPYELLGEEKVKESLIRVVKAARILSTNFGRIYINFGPIISVKEYYLAQAPPNERSLEAIQKNPELRKTIIESLGYKITYSMMDGIVVMPTSMVSALVLMNRRGITEDMLIKKMEWLSQQLIMRGAKTLSLQGGQVDSTVHNAIILLSDIITKSKKNIFELQVTPNLGYKNILLLSYYRNQLAHIFVQEGIICCALSAFGHQISFRDGVSGGRLWEETEFLLKLLKREFVLQGQIRTQRDFEAHIELMVTRQVLNVVEGQVRVAEKNGEHSLQFLCSFIWPLIESYWVTLVYLYSVQKNQNSIGLKKLTQQIQWFAESMHEERIMEHYESCSQETIKNAIYIYKEMKIIKMTRETSDDMITVIIGEDKLLDLENQLKKFLKNSYVKSIQTPFEIARKTMSVDYDIFPKI